MRHALDQALEIKGKISIETSHTRFSPTALAHISAATERGCLPSTRVVPALAAMNRKANGRGLYFERMVMYGRGPCDGNQLEWILSQYVRGRACAVSMLQATTFDPGRDHVASAQLGFPCLQHVSFVPTTAGLVTNAFYATQYIFDKAYGNYLGLAQLGAFMAHEMGMPLARLNVIVGIAKLERYHQERRRFRAAGRGRPGPRGAARRSGCARRSSPRPQEQRFEFEVAQSPAETSARPPSEVPVPAHQRIAADGPARRRSAA